MSLQSSKAPNRSETENVGNENRKAPLPSGLPYAGPLLVADGQTRSLGSWGAHFMSAVTLQESAASLFLLFLFYIKELIKLTSLKHLRACEHTVHLLSKRLSWLTPCSLREAITYCPLIKSSSKNPLISPWS